MKDDDAINIRFLEASDDPRALRRQSTVKRAAAERSGQRHFLSWIEQDIENRLGLYRGGRYTTPNMMFSLVIGSILTGLFYGGIFLIRGSFPALDPFTLPLVRPANLWTGIPGMFLFFWGLAFLILKHRKIAFQRRALDLTAVPQQPDFLLTEATARSVLDRLHGFVDHPRHFLLLNRIERALSSLHNMGAVTDVSAVLNTQAENDENQMASSYTLVSGFVWATPVLGFIGTVLGLSQAIARFTAILRTDKADISSVTSGLQNVTGGLATAFETTLVALVCALILQLYISFLQHKESAFLDACNDFCHANVIAKLRLIRRDSTNTSDGRSDDKAAVRDPS